MNFILNLLSPRSASGSTSPTANSPLDDTLRRLCFSLAPLKSVEMSLTKRISGSASPVVLDSSTTSADSPYAHYHPAKASEISVRSGAGWKGLLKFRRHSNASLRGYSPEDIQNRRIISACADDITALWTNPDVQEKLREEDISLKNQPGLYVPASLVVSPVHSYILFQLS